MVNDSELNCTLLGDGPRDEVLNYPIRWLLRDLCGLVAVQLEWADWRRLRGRPHGLADRMSAALKLYRTDILFVHRDAERQSRNARVAEIKEAAARVQIGRQPFVCVIPVRMTEAWLLFSERAIREAASNPNGSTFLDLPPMKDVESKADPKRILRDLLLDASELPSHRRHKFRVGPAVHRLAQLIPDYGRLRELSAFRAFEADLKETLHEGGWLAD